MKKDFLFLRPSRYLCPICGEWHDWKQQQFLGYHNINIPAEFLCENSKSTYRVFLDGNYLFFQIELCCSTVKLLEGSIEIDLIKEHSPLLPIVTFDIPITIKSNDLKYCNCNLCAFFNKCNILKASISNSKEITFGFAFEP